MSDPDELDEAVALANTDGVPAKRRRAPAASSSRPPRGGRRQEEGDDDLVPPWLLPAATDSGRDGVSGEDGGSGIPEPPGDDLAPAWLVPPAGPDGRRGARGHDRTEHGQPPRAATAASPPTAPPPPASPPKAPELTWDEARRLAERAVRAARPVTVSLDRALHQVLAAPVTALNDLPSFDTAAMDGWAVSGPGPWTPDAEEGPGALAGHGAARPLADGQATRIATGARLPPGATAVLRSEHGSLHGGRLHLARPAPAHGAEHGAEHGTDIRPRGQECRSGEQLLAAGLPVTPAVLGLCAAAGYDELRVVPRPRVEVLVLGDELLQQGRPRQGRIRDALGPMTGPWLEALGADVLVTRRLGDDAEALHEAVATTTADLLVTTGGTAHGPADHVRPVLRRLGARRLIDGVGVRPGHPMLLAALATERNRRNPDSNRETGREAPAHTCLIGLPGNPLAAVSGLLTLADPLIRALGGRPAAEPVHARLTGEVTAHPFDTRLVPVTHTPGSTTAEPVRYTGPAMLRGIAGATALAVIPPGAHRTDVSVRLMGLPWPS